MVKTLKPEFYEGTITTEVISRMQIGEELRVSSDKSDILRTRVSEVNSANRITSQKARWTTFTRTSPLGYISVTRIK